MPRENSFSDSDGRSLTPDLEDDPAMQRSASPNPDAAPAPPPVSNGTPSAAAIDGLPQTTSSKPQVSGLSFSEIRATDRKDAQSAQPTSPRSNNAAQPTSPVPGAASARFRNSVRKIIFMKRTSTVMSMLGAGAEPGIDPRRSSAHLNYGHIKADCVIDIADYSSVRSSFGRMQNKGFVEYMNDAQACKREPWVRVRWIHVAGISWDVISTLALKYNLHPLAIEDVLHQRPQSRSKADYYPNHLFIRILRHCLAAEGEDNGPFDIIPNKFTDLPRSSSPTGFQDDDLDSEGDKTAYESGGSRNSTRKWTRSKSRGPEGRNGGFPLKDLEQGPTETLKKAPTTFSVLARREQTANAMTIDQLKKGRVNVKTTPMFMFLSRDGTVISIQASSDIDFIAPITARLRQRDTGLRATADASLLLQSLMDLVVDQALEVVDEYQKEILKLERDVLIKPKMKTVRQLHILSGDLTLHKRTLEPIKTLVYGLRRYDVDRCVALIETPLNDKQKAAVEGFMSHKSKIYLADVNDHMEYILSSMDMFSNIAENLINYTFNLSSYDMNSVMRRLTQITIICLPLTLLTGYFGMNFTRMWSVLDDNHSDLVFWVIALPVMAIVLPVFMWQDIVSMVHYVKKRWTAKQTAKAVKKKQ